jgi:uncharacterized protein YndB with AHSA1/START domain
MPDHVVTRSVVVDAPPEEAWDALVELEEWFADDVEAEELVADAEVSFSWDDGERRDAVIEEVDAPKRLAFRWRDPDGQESHVAFDLDEHETGTRVTVVESGLTDRAAARRAATWGPSLVALSAASRAVLA